MNPCPTCHSQLDPGTPHTFCARTKEPKARELDARITDVERTLRLYADDDCKHGGRSVLARLEALERDRSDRGALATKLKDLAYEHADTLTLTELRDLFDVAANHENTGAARGDGSEQQPLGSRGQHEEPGRSDSLVEGHRPSVPVTAAYTAPAASALPMPERPKWIDNSWSEEQFSTNRELGVFGTAEGRCRMAEDERLYALSLESRLAAANESIGVRDRNVDTLVADIAALKAKLAEADKALGGYKADNASLRKTTEEAVERAARLKLERDGNVWIWERDADNEIESLVCPVLIQADALRAIIADRDALRAKLDEAEKSLACNGIIPAYVVRDVIKSALAAAENTNTRAGSSTTRATTQDPSHRDGSAQVSEVGGENPSRPAPSPATEFEMTAGQRKELGRALNRCSVAEVREQGAEILTAWKGLCACVESIVRSELRKAREGWVTRDAAIHAMSCWGSRASSCAHNHQDECLDSAIRAASKESPDGTR